MRIQCSCYVVVMDPRLGIVLAFVCSLGCSVDGGWTEWSSWSDCTVTCGMGGFTTRTRQCLEDTTPCHGDNLEGDVCSMDPCPVDGFWLEWSSWTNCSLLCGSGTRQRQRDCQEPIHGGMPCQGEDEEIQVCNTEPCSIDGYFNHWSDWYACPVPCGGSVQTRNRSCIGPFHSGKPCQGSTDEERECNIDPCPIHGAWSEWTLWSECSVTCNRGVIIRQRVCDNPAPEHGGDPCTGSSSHTMDCFPLTCPRNGGWSLWLTWTECSHSCGWGFRERKRVCDNPTPAYGGQNCVGAQTAGESCMLLPCPVDGSWGPWSEWSHCSKSCGSGGNHTRTRLCNFPPPLHDGQYCSGSSWQAGNCYVDRCDVDGGWSDWSEWSVCNKDCETGLQYRNRTCDNPPPTVPVGEQCHGPFNESRECNAHICPVHGGWSDWSPWTRCPVTCGGDIETRYHVCTDPPPMFNGNSCEGPSNEDRACSTDGCPVDGAWTQWSSWLDCSTTCGGGNTSRWRTCTNPAAVWGGMPCPGTDPSEEWKNCNMFHCPIHGGWSEWTAWPECPVSCDGFELIRSRACTNPVPQHQGSDCEGELRETLICNQNPCPVNGSWTLWSVWSECSESCEGGIQFRERTCTDPAPAYGGTICSGNWTNDSGIQAESEEQDCNFHACPIDGGFTAWTEWPSCPVTCGGASIYRYRNCTNPVAEHGGLDCQGSNTSHMICNGDVQCPIHGSWGHWLNWASCSKPCENGTIFRIRLCNDPSPLYGGNSCEGDIQEVRVCNTHRCEVHGGYSLWSHWNSCTKSCGGGQTQRTRDCTNPAPAFGGNPCEGPAIQKRLCAAFYCPVDGGFSAWADWTPCPVTCGGALINRSRVCNSPAPRHGGLPCQGSTMSSSVCAENPCPVDGLWTLWSTWSQCSTTCGDGHELKTRNCSEPAPAFGGTDCIGARYREVVCYHENQCPVLPLPPFNLTFSVTVSDIGLVSVYISWDQDEPDASATDYYVVQAKSLQTQGVPRGSASAYEWQSFATVMGVHRRVPIRDYDQGNVGLFDGDLKVRVLAGNQYRQTSSQEHVVNALKHLLGGSERSASFLSPVLMVVLSASVLHRYV